MQSLSGPNLLRPDLDSATTLLEPVWEKLAGASLFITGGTGFFGRWLLETLAWANFELECKIKATVLSRNPDRFLRSAPHLGSEAGIKFITGDIRDFDFPVTSFDYVLHAATDTTNLENSEATFRAIVEGTQRVIELAKAGSSSLHYVSSGAVYGRRTDDEPFPAEMSSIDPQRGELPDAYRDGKRTAERLVLQSGLNARISRCFAFHGPHLPLDAHYAIGNFLADRLYGRPIIVKGDGSPLRSYLYASDLAVWLWTILAEGIKGEIYNVGSGEAISIGHLAHMVGEEFEPNLLVDILQSPEPGRPAPAYVPDVDKAKYDLGLTETVSLQEGLSRTLSWLGA